MNIDVVRIISGQCIRARSALQPVFVSKAQNVVVANRRLGREHRLAQFDHAFLTVILEPDDFDRIVSIAGQPVDEPDTVGRIGTFAIPRTEGDEQVLGVRRQVMEAHLTGKIIRQQQDIYVPKTVVLNRHKAAIGAHHIDVARVATDQKLAINRRLQRVWLVEPDQRVDPRRRLVADDPRAHVGGGPEGAVVKAELFDPVAIASLQGIDDAHGRSICEIHE